MTSAPGQAARSTTTRLIDVIEDHPEPALFAFTVGFFGLAFIQSWLKPVWYDEFFTIHVARLPHLSDLWPLFFPASKAARRWSICSPVSLKPFTRQ